MVKIDFHVHTFYSDCAERNMTLEKVLLEYEKLCFERVALTDHCYLDRLHIFWQEKKEIEKIKEKFDLKLKVYVSSEVCCISRNGRLVCENVPYVDYMSVAPHHYSYEKKYQLGKNLLEDAKEMLLALAKKENIKIILHPFVHLMNDEFVKNKIAFLPSFYWKEFAKRVKESNKIVEIHKDMDDRWLPMIEELVRNKVCLVVGSDCHRQEDIGKIENAVALIKKVDASYSEIGEI